MSKHQVTFGPMTEEVVRLIQERERAYWGRWLTLGEALEWVMEDIKNAEPDVPAYGRFSPALRSILEQAARLTTMTVSDDSINRLNQHPEDFDLSRNKETVRLFGGERLVNVHSAEICQGSYCAIHNQSDHSMREFPQHWRGDRGIMERICLTHGTGHPDPDDYRIRMGLDSGIHGCCGCCVHHITEDQETVENG